MQNRTGALIALIAAVLAIVIVATGGPLVAAVSIALGGGLSGSLATRSRKRDTTVGIR